MNAIVKLSVRMTLLGLILSSTTACDLQRAVPVPARGATPPPEPCTATIDDLDPGCESKPPG